MSVEGDGGALRVEMTRRKELTLELGSTGMRLELSSNYFHETEIDGKSTSNAPTHINADSSFSSAQIPCYQRGHKSGPGSGSLWPRVKTEN